MEGTPGKTCVVIVSGSIARSVSFTVTQTGGTASGNGAVTDNFLHFITLDLYIFCRPCQYNLNFICMVHTSL